jgi:hypothetical protein
MLSIKVSKLCAAVVFFLFCLLISINSGFAQSVQPTHRTMKQDEVAAKIKAARKNNKDIHAALAYFEKRGQPIQYELASGVTGPRPVQVASLRPHEGCRANFSLKSFDPLQQIIDPSGTGGWVELMWIPALSLPYEWHGTAVGDEYDSAGNLVREYVAEIVLQMPDPNIYQWNVVFEAPVAGGVVGDPLGGPGLLLTIDASKPLSIQAKTIKKELSSPRVAPAKWLGGWGAWGKCSAAWCGGAAAGCAAANFWNAEVAFGPCAAAGCIGGAIGCTYGTLWN